MDLHAYAGDIMVIGRTTSEIITKTADLITAVMPMIPVINQNKSKYMVIDRQIWNTLNLIVDNYTFQTVTNIKYFGTNINNTYNIHKEIK